MTTVNLVVTEEGVEEGFLCSKLQVRKMNISDKFDKK